MKVSDNDLAALRAALDGDVDAFDRLHTEHRGVVDNGFTALMATAFVRATRQQFGHDWSVSDVIRFVGEVRTRFSGGDLSPTTAEEMILTALRNTPMRTGSDDGALGDVQITLLAVLVNNLDSRQRALLFQKARADAEQWLSQDGQAT